MKDRLAEDYWGVTSKGDLEEAVLKLWNEFPQEDLNNLAESMPRRMEAVIASKGGYTKY
jgi:hypothetical protein